MAAKKTQAARGKAAAQKHKPSAPPRSGRASEVIGVILMAMGVFAGYLMWMEPDSANQTMTMLRAWIRGAAGMLGYVAPLMLVGMGIIVMFVGRRRVRAHRALLTLIGALTVCGIWHIFSTERIAAAMTGSGYAGFILASWEEGMQTCAGAGALGALTTWHLYGYLDVWGTAIALFGVLVVIALCMSRTSVREMGERISGCISGGMDEYRERRQVRGREKAELRAQALARRVAREEQERERRENAERSIEQERARREDAETRVDELQRRRRQLRQDGQTPHDDDEAEDARPARQPRRPAQAAPARTAQTTRPVQPVAEDDLETAKARSRGDQEAYNQAMREHMAQEGVPMFLDKRVPGRAITSAGAAPIKGPAQPDAHGDGPRMVFRGYDEPGEARQPDAATYTDPSYHVSQLPDVERAVLELDGLAELPDTSRVDELLRENARPAPSEADVVMRPLRQERDYTLDVQPVAPDAEARRVAHASAPVRRIADAKQRYEAAMEPPEQLDERPDYDVEYAPDDAPYARRMSAQRTAPAAAPVFSNARPAGEPQPGDMLRSTRGVRDGFTPAPDSAYAAGIAYDNGMPFEQYSAPAPAPQAVPLDDEPEQLAELEPVTPAQPDEPEYAEPAYDDCEPAFDESAPDMSAAEDMDDMDYAEDDAMQPDDAQPVAENISFDGYSGEGGVNEEIAMQHTPEIVPEVAAKVAMYTPVQADLDRQYGDGQRLDGSPIRMPKPAMEEIPQDKPYFYPPVDLLNFSRPAGVSLKEQQQLDEEKALKLEQTLQSFGIQAKVVGVSRGPAITRFEMTPAPGVRVSKISGLADDIALNLAATTVRIEAPIPGKSAVGIELPNDQREMVTLRDVLDSPEAAKAQSKLAVALGKDNAGKLVIADIAKMPHVLIAGATGSGKSVCINTIIMSIIYRATPDEVRLILIDPKVVELSVYNGVPHLLVPVVTDPKKAASALNWAVLEMTERYQRFADRGVRDIKGYNQKLEDGEKPMPQIVVIIDELADLMMVAPGEVEESICRLAQLARAAGIHLVIATQRPSVNVITGVIKANIPSRIAFTVASQVDSRTILDGAGAEKLLGRGDMLFFPQGVSKPQRVQGANVTDEEVTNVIEFIKSQHEAVYNPDILEQMERADQSDAEKEEELNNDCDPLLPKAVEIAVELGQVSISMLQRRMRIGYSRAGRIVDEMTQRGIVGAADGAKPRMLLITREEFKRLFGDQLDS